MRPIRLEIQGLTAYKERVEINFAELDLFAITGPTGAGKTTIVDAISYALFGRIPRVSDDIKQLISQGAERLRVVLEFSSSGQRYRIHRSTGHKGSPTVQLERLDATGEWAAETERSREATRYVERILGMDYEGFTRSILLPQGQFQQFLAGKPEERRKVLDGLLRLDVFDRMLKRANEIAREHSTHAESLQQALEQYAGASPEALEASRSVLAELRERTKELATLKTAIFEATKAAESLAIAITKREQAEKAASAASDELARSQKLLDTGAKSITEMTKALTAIEKQIEGNPYDADLFTRLSQALDLVQRVEKSEKRLAELNDRAKNTGPRLAKLKKQATEAGKSAEDALRALKSADAHLESARREDLAASVRHGLQTGDSCPVCGQTIALLPTGDHGSISDAEAMVNQAREADVATRKTVQSLETEIAVAERDAQSLASQITDLESDCGTERAKLTELLGEQEAVTASIAKAVRNQETARRERERLVAEEKETRAKLDELKSEIAAANQSLATQRAQIELHQKEAKEYQSEIDSAGAALADAARQHDWDDLIDRLDSGRTASPVLQQRLDAAESQQSAANQQIGRAEAEIKRIEDGITKAHDIRDEMDKASSAATLAKDLASLLRVTAFPNYIREHALKALARDGSAHLRNITNQRYEFRVAGQEFLVTDGWNLGETRSAKTLSGGETFLASLALALALAETLPTLGAGARADTLECLLIDEGFSNLDRSTLNDVVNALEVIGKDRTRMVGIVTHLDELADRMPTRIRVRKEQSNSTVTIE